MMLYMNRKFNKKLNHKRIYRLMKVAGLKSVIRKKKNVIFILSTTCCRKCVEQRI
ncbi:IS3 family transposase [Halalkalibacter lacteus]|uniref:IS3 family transposase n=1 Tax=Halalkalibacter lacteus TaxID=3090663 RepID=UPI003D66E1DA